MPFIRRAALWTGAACMGLTAARRVVRSGRRIGFADRAAVITGGSRGLGLEIARLLAAEGAHVALLARSEEELEAARRDITERGGRADVFPCDLRNREDIVRTSERLLARLGRVDVLVNNAGIIEVGPLENMTRDSFEQSMGVHLWGHMDLIEQLLPVMIRQGDGRIANVTSIAGLVAVPHLLPYVTSKYAFVGYSDGLRGAVARHGIRVTTVAPFLMRTGSHVHALFKGQHRKEYAWFSIADALAFSMRSDRAARRIVEAIRYGEPRLIPSIPAKLAHAADTLFPHLTAAVQSAAARLLPGPASDDHIHEGKDSASPLSPSILTARADEMIRPNNEANPAPSRT